MKTYTILKGSTVYRSITHPKGHKDEGKMTCGWASVITDREVTYTSEDLRSKNKSTFSEYYEFNLPKRAKPHTILAVLTENVNVAFINTVTTDRQKNNNA